MSQKYSKYFELPWDESHGNNLNGTESHIPRAKDCKCPLCGKKLKDMLLGTTHIKSCARSRGLSTVDLFALMDEMNITELESNEHPLTNDSLNIPQTSTGKVQGTVQFPVLSDQTIGEMTTESNLEDARTRDGFKIPLNPSSGVGNTKTNGKHFTMPKPTFNKVKKQSAKTGGKHKISRFHGEGGFIRESPYKKMTGNNLTTSNQNVKETVVPIKIPPAKSPLIHKVSENNEAGPKSINVSRMPLNIPSPHAPVLKDILKMLTDQVETDAILTGKDKIEVKCHTFMLHARCPRILADAVYSIEDSFTVPKIMLNNCSHATVEAFVKFIYTGDIPEAETTLSEFNFLAKQYDIDLE